MQADLAHSLSLSVRGFLKICDFVTHIGYRECSCASHSYSPHLPIHLCIQKLKYQCEPNKSRADDEGEAKRARALEIWRPGCRSMVCHDLTLSLLPLKLAEAQFFSCKIIRLF